MRMRGTGEYERNLGCCRGHSGIACRGVRGCGRGEAKGEGA